MTESMSFSVRADLHRVASGFSTDGTVRIEPLRQGGVILAAQDGENMIALVDRTGEANRAGTVAIGKALLNMAVDLFRRDGIAVRLRGRDELAFIEPDLGNGQAVRGFERPGFPDWRRIAERHMITRLDPPLVFDARLAKRLSDAAIGLARAARSTDETFRLLGGVDATVATFTAWDEAFAVFDNSQDMADAKLAQDRSTLWHPPSWSNQHALGAAEGVRQC